MHLWNTSNSNLFFLMYSFNEFFSQSAFWLKYFLLPVTICLFTPYWSVTVVGLTVVITLIQLLGRTHYYWYPDMARQSPIE